jgi:hypothetical protein
MCMLRCVLLVILLFFGIGGNQSWGAVIVASNFGPAVSDQGWELNGTSETYQAISARFQVPPSRAPLALEYIELLTYLESPPNIVDISMAEVSPLGLPGRTLEAFRLTDTMHLSQAAVATARSILRPELSPGASYWLTASVPTGTIAYWLSNTTGDVTDGSNLAWDLGGGWMSLPASGLARPTFRVAASAIPEPSTAMLVFSAAAIMLLVIRRR